MNALHDLADTLADSAASLAGAPVVTGFDGFVDEMITVVRERRDSGDYDRVETISEFGGLIQAAAGKSSLREIVVRQTDPGGCAVNLMDGLASLGVPVTTFATLGEPTPHPAFAGYRDKATLHSWGAEPGRTLAYEFADGKLMHSAVEQLAAFTPKDLARRLKDGIFAGACREARLIALTDWTLFPHMTACWRLLQDEVFSEVARDTPIFLDLVDPASRSADDVREMLEVLPGFQDCGPTTLGLNVNEANHLAGLLGLAVPPELDPDETLKQAVRLKETLALAGIVVHSHRFAVAASEDGEALATTFYETHPLKSTGAGDRFNAGYTAGIILGLSVEERLVLANAVAGCYVRSGMSPSLGEVRDFLRNQGSC